MTAKHFGLIYVDTGAIYRCVGLFAIKSNVETKDEAGVQALLDKIDIEIKYDDQGIQHMFLNGQDVSAEIRMPEISIAASNVSAMAAVRKKLLSMQRQMAVKYNVIMDGRDIGTVVLPNAGLKIFLTADTGERAKRRYAELKEKNVDTTYEEVLKDIKYRDANDSSRANSPLKAADDALHMDTTQIGLEESFEMIKKVVSERLGL
jgi:cytidylate kinase